MLARRAGKRLAAVLLALPLLAGCDFRCGCGCSTGVAAEVLVDGTAYVKAHPAVHGMCEKVDGGDLQCWPADDGDRIVDPVSVAGPGVFTLVVEFRDHQGNTLVRRQTRVAVRLLTPGSKCQVELDRAWVSVAADGSLMSLRGPA